MGEVSGGDSQYHSQQQHGQSGGEQHSQVTSSSNFNHDHARRSDNDGSAFDHSREDHRLYFDNGQQIYPL